MDDSDLAGLISKAKGGDNRAFADLVRRFEPEVRMIVRGRLPRSLQAQFDSMDFVQSLWKSVLRKDGADMPCFENSRHFMGYLAGVARNKVYEQYRKRTHTRKYDIKREEPLYVRKGNRDVPRDLPGHDSSPSQEAQAEDRLAQLLEGRSPLEEQVVQLRRQGFTYEEIADRLGLHESAIRRMIDVIRKRLEARPWQ